MTTWRRTAILLLLIAGLAATTLARSSRGGGGRGGDDDDDDTDCGTCDSLGYTCVRNDTLLRDRCGRAINASACPVRACDAYCRLMVPNATDGVCNDATHLCDCTVPPPQRQPAPAPPPRARAAVDCSVLSCAAIRAAGWQCIPNGTVDGCTRDVLHEHWCVDARDGGVVLPCDTTCRTVTGNSRCDARTNRCLCGTGTVVVPPSVGPSGGSAAGASPRASATPSARRTGTSTSGGARAAAIDSNVTRLNGNGSLDTSTTVFAVIIVLAVAVALVIGGMIIYGLFPKKMQPPGTSYAASKNQARETKGLHLRF